MRPTAVGPGLVGKPRCRPTDGGHTHLQANRSRASRGKYHSTDLTTGRSVRYAEFWPAAAQHLRGCDLRILRECTPHDSVSRVSVAPHRIPVVSVFSGAGGLDLGFHNAGFRTVMAVDASKSAVSSYNGNFDGSLAEYGNLAHQPTLKKLVERARDSHAVGVIGGPPCQGFSKGNVTKRSNDPRNRLIYRFAQIVELLNKDDGLDFFLMENVTGLTYPSQRNRYRQLLRRFNKSGFTVYPRIVNARDFGVAQVRRRVLLIGLNTTRFPEHNIKLNLSSIRNRTVRDMLHGLPDATLFHRDLTSNDIPFHPNHWTMQPRSNRFSNGDFNRWRSFRRLQWDDPSPTVAYGNREIHVHPDGKRRLSVFEAMLLQGLPKRFVLKGNLSEQVTQVSNLVPPPVARAAARAIHRAITS